MIPLWWYCPRWVEGEEDTVQMLPFASACLWASLLSLLASAAVRAPEGASGWGLVITGRLQQLFLQHGSRVTVFLHCCLGRCLLCDKSQFLLALKPLKFRSDIGAQCCSEQSQGSAWVQQPLWDLALVTSRGCWHFAALCHFTLGSMAAFSMEPSFHPSILTA